MDDNTLQAVGKEIVDAAFNYIEEYGGNVYGIENGEVTDRDITYPGPVFYTTIAMRDYSAYGMVIFPIIGEHDERHGEGA
jgi:hypothetical protein